VFEIDRTRCCKWLVDAAEQLRPSPVLLHDVHVTQVQLDELYACSVAVKDGKVSEGPKHRAPGSVRPSGSVACGPREQTLLLALTSAIASLGHGQTRGPTSGAGILAPDCAPLFLTRWLQGVHEPPAHPLMGNGARSRAVRLPASAETGAGCPCRAALNAQVIKTVRRRRLVDVKHRVVFGTLSL